MYLENRPLRNCPLRFCFIFIFFFHHSDMFIHWRLIYRVFQKEDCKFLISTFFTTSSVKARIFVAIYFLWQRLNIFFSPVLLWTAPISNMEFLNRLFRQIKHQVRWNNWFKKRLNFKRFLFHFVLNHNSIDKDATILKIQFLI